MTNEEYEDDYEVNNDIAIIGMAGRFPKADNVEEFWTNLVSSTDCITRFSLEELAKMGVSQAALSDPNFVPAAGYIPDQDKFDAHFFEMNPREAANLDPQHRFALEIAWQTLEHAGYTPESVNGSVGIFAGVNMSTYFIFNLLRGDEATRSGDALDMQISVDKDMFASRISYKLNLNGPSISLGTACSTSLVCIHLACQSLLNGESKMALAGGSHLATPNCTGHIYHQGGYSSPDGYCRAFDAKGKGTVGGAGTCFVLLKRMEDAIADNDTIYAVIKGSAINNDGSEKIGYTAPSIVGQTNIVAEAQAVAGVEPESIRFIEAHGTATELGDPIEFTALTRAFRLQTDKKNFCGIGSVKTNIGHLGMAAGVTSVVKASLALKNKVIPESLNFESPNPKLDIENSPFYVVDKLERIEEGEYPARAGVSSLGIGGTNAHIVLEEPPVVESSDSRPWQLVLLSAKTPSALDRMTENLSGWMARTADEKIADAAFTLQVGRTGFDFRRAFVVPSERLGRLAQNITPGKGYTGKKSDKQKKVVFMFPGGGTQYVNMARGLYQTEPTFKETLDSCAALFKRKMGLDLVELIFPTPERAEANAEMLQRPKNFFAALFAVEYSLAKLWMSWGVKPDAVIGHSLGEYTAACLAGVFSLESAVDLICCRGALFEKIEKGSMFTVALSVQEMESLLKERPIDGVSIAAVNDPGRCVVAGRLEPMQTFEKLLEERQVEFRKLHIDTAGHSPMVDPILQEFGQFLSTVKFGTPAIPLMSNLSGNWADAKEICTPDYWKKHLRQTVRFADGVAALLNDDCIFLEVGPGNALSSFVRSQVAGKPENVLLTSMRHIKEEKDDLCHLLETTGKLWMAGVDIDWKAFYAQEKRKRIGLPAYPFDRKRYWVENRKSQTQAGAKLPVADWFWQPSWRLEEQKPAAAGIGSQDIFLFFLDNQRYSASLIAGLRARGARVISVAHGSAYSEIDENSFHIHSADSADYQRLIKRLSALNAAPKTIVHCWSLSETGSEEQQRLNIQLSLVYLAQALAAAELVDGINLLAVTNRRETVLKNDVIDCMQSLITGPANVIPYEYPGIRFVTLDVNIEETDDEAFTEFALGELAALADNGASQGARSLALRNGLRFAKDYISLATPDNFNQPAAIKPQGVYLITGGLGGVGMAHAQALAAFQTKLAIVQRSSFPAAEQWEAIAADASADALLREQIKSIKALQAQGAQVLVLQADVTDAGQLSSAVARIRQELGPVNGLIHCAGYGEFVPIKDTSKDVIDAVLAPKVAGTNQLLAALANEKLELVLLCSSMSAQTTGYGLVGYVSACAYLDAVAQAHKSGAARYLSINWDVWSTPQQTIKAQSDSALAQRLQDNATAILPREGVEVIYRALSSDKPQAIISTTDFQQLLRKNQKLSDAMSVDSEDAATGSEQGGGELYDRPSLSSEYVAPTTEEEKLLASIWQETLGISKIGINDNFFELGGESLLGVKIVVKAKKMGLHIDPKQMFATPTIAQIAANLGKNEPASDAAQVRQAGDTYALTPLQTEIYDRYCEAGRAPSNIIQALSVMEGPLDKQLLQAVWQALVGRHKVLRTRFAKDDKGTAMQVVEPHANFALTELDYSHLDEAAQQQALDALMFKDRTARYDLTQAPPMRVYWVTLDAQRARFAILLSQHQIILDGWTSSLLSRDLFACMMSLASGGNLPAPVSTVDFGAYVEWLATQNNDDNRAWWRDTFADYAQTDPLQSIMSLTPLIETGADRYGAHELGIDDGLLAQIQDCAKATRTTGNAVFQAAWALSLAQLNGGSDIVYGITISGRSGGFEGVEEVVGQCTNSLPVRIPVSGGMTIAQLLQAVHAANADAQAHNGLSASQVAELAGCNAPLYSSNFIFENVPRAVSGEGDMPIKTLATKWVDGWHFPLRLFVVPEEKTWIRVAFDRNKFSMDDIAELAANYHQNLAAIAEQPDAAVSQMLLGDRV
ncbi:MAG: SDR family NAD(P)-dependent oxidoreductase [Burkholderiales bacterium]|nr:SDR family NAD(P)-dependent oxidoreductase [Burkholderiales bacterium]